MNTLPAEQPGRLIWQGRALLVLMSMRYFLVGGLAIFAPTGFRAETLRTVVPIEVWGMVALAAAGAAFTAAVAGTEAAFRVSTVASFFLTGIITALLFAALAEDELAVPLAPIFGMMLMLIDLIVGSMQVVVLPLPETLPSPPEE